MYPLLLINAMICKLNELINIYKAAIITVKKKLTFYSFIHNKNKIVTIYSDI